MKKQNDILSKFINALKNQSVPANPPQELIDDTLQKLSVVNAGGPAFTERTVAIRRFAKLAAAAAVIALAACWLTMSNRSELEPHEADKPAVAMNSQTPAKLMSVISLNLVFRDGDMEAVEKQFERAEKKVRQGLKERLTVEQLICELDGC